MLPLKDDIPSRSLPLVTIGIIVANVVAFTYQASLQIGGDPTTTRAAQDLVGEFGLVPCRLTGQCASGLEVPHPTLTVLTSMFLHGGLFHVGGNMLYLWIFGDNVEDTLGHGRFLGFYLAAGAAAAVSQVLMSPSSTVPMIGASGAVSGVLGAYLLLFPHARILTLVTFGFFWRFIHLPAAIVLGFWVVVQFLNGYLTFAEAGGGGGGVAWFAHIGGFLAGMLLLPLLRSRRARRW